MDDKEMLNNPEMASEQSAQGENLTEESRELENLQKELQEQKVYTTLYV